MSGGFDEERFRALMALEEMLERPIRPLRPESEPVWEIRRETGAARPETAEAPAEMPEPVETTPEAAEDAEPADKEIEKAEQADTVAGEPPEEPKREVLYRTEEPELPAAGREGTPERGPEEPAAARDVRYRVETAGTERAAPIYRVELPVETPDRYRAEPPEPVWTGELPVMEESGLALGDQARAAVQMGRRDLQTVQLVQEVQDKESGPSLRDWDRYWEREERRYDGGFFLF